MTRYIRFIAPMQPLNTMRTRHEDKYEFWLNIDNRRIYAIYAHANPLYLPELSVDLTYKGLPYTYILQIMGVQ